MRIRMMLRGDCVRLWAMVGTAACTSAAPAVDPIDAVDTVDTADGDGITDAAPRALPVLESSDELCKLFSNANPWDPTANAVQFRANVRGADLGIPVVAGDRLYLLFGDTMGFAGIWGDGESHPDAVGYASGGGTDPIALCDGLRLLTLPPEASIGPTLDPRIEADFAGAAMTPPPGHALAEYIHNPAGSFANLPGDFEVPSGGFAIGDALYALYTTVASPSDVTMTAAYLARWDAPGTTGIPAYQIVGAIDDPDFVNIAAVVAGDAVYLFGTGVFRASPVHLARLPIAAIDTPAAIERVDAPIIATPGYGETSVRYFAAIDRWMFLAEELAGGANRIVARFADAPTGPWSDAIAIHDMADAGFRARYCCAVDDACAGDEFMNCDRTGFYGAYLFPDVELGADGRFTITYTLSSFDPYNVALFRATFIRP